MGTALDFVMDMDEATCHQIIKEYHQFEEEGSIGDCILREKGEEFATSLGAPNGPYIITWMGELYKNCLLRFYRKNY